MPAHGYATPGGEVGGQFLYSLVEDLRGGCEGKWSTKHFIVFQTVILKQLRHMSGSQAIQQLIEKRLDA